MFINQLLWDNNIIIWTGTFFSSMCVTNNMDMESEQLLTGLGTGYLQ
jgi:hypothetical protein